MEGENGREKILTSHEVVVVIPGTEEYSSTNNSRVDSVDNKISGKPANIEVKKQEIDMSTASSPGRISLSPTQNHPPKTPTTETSFRRRSLAGMPQAKSKSRLIESPYNNTVKLDDDKAKIVPASSSSVKSGRTSTPRGSGSRASTPVTPRTPLMASRGGEDDEEDDNVYITGRLRGVEKKQGKSIKFMIVVEWIMLVGLTGVLISNLTVNRFKNAKIWDLRLWKWCVLVLVLCCGRLLTGWFSNLLTFLIERNFLLKSKVFYFLYALRSSVRFFLWIGIILLVWVLLINQKEDRSEEAHKALNKITRGIACTLLGSALWMVKTFLIKLLASVFQSKTFFDRIQENIYHQYVLQTLSGPPMMDIERRTGNIRANCGQLSFGNSVHNGKPKKGEESINVDKLKRMDRQKVSAWTMSGLIDVIRGSHLSTIYSTLEEMEDEEGEGEGEKRDITSEIEAKVEAKRVFKNVAKRGNKHIERKDLSSFLPDEEIDIIFPMFEGALETRQIKKSAFTTWVVLVYTERKRLSHSLNDTKTAIEELNRITSIILLVIIFILWLLLMDITTTEVMIFIGSQVLLVAFMFGDTLKTVFEGIIFNFVAHPFDVGDRVVIDGIEMVVEEMNLMTTIFLRQDNEKIYYPNVVLASLPISNFNRSPPMADSVEFAVDFSTSVESIASLKDNIKTYLESKPQHWSPNHSVLVEEIEDVNKMKMSLYVTHTMNFQDATERKNRRSDLVFELKKIFEKLGIKYRLPPQEVLITYVASEPSTANINQ